MTHEQVARAFLALGAVAPHESAVVDDGGIRIALEYTASTAEHKLLTRNGWQAEGEDGDVVPGNRYTLNLARDLGEWRSW